MKIVRERHDPDQVGKGEDGVEDDEEGGEDCPEELSLNRHGDYIIIMIRL